MGGIGDYPVGETRTLPVGEILIESLPEGLRAISSDGSGRHFAIVGGPHGGLLVDCARVWPAHRVYSVMTGEPAEISTSWEEDK